MGVLHVSTKTLTGNEPEQPFAFVPKTVYVVKATGEATTVCPVVAERPVDGLQVYVAAPDAVNVTDAVPHTIGLTGLTVIGIGLASQSTLKFASTGMMLLPNFITTGPVIASSGTLKLHVLGEADSNIPVPPLEN